MLGIDKKITEVAERAVSLDFGDRRQTFCREVNQIGERMGASGMRSSSIAQGLIVDAIGNEFRVRATLVWHAIARAMDAVGAKLDKSIADDIKSWLRVQIERGTGDLAEYYEEAENSLPRIRPLNPSLDQLREAALSRINSEIDFAVLKHKSERDTPTSTVNIFQTYGVVQTGSGSSTILHVEIREEENREIVSALAAVEQALKEATALNATERIQALELVTDAMDELKRRNPNSLKLRGILPALASTVQTIAAAPQAVLHNRGLVYPPRSIPTLANKKDSSKWRNLF